VIQLVVQFRKTTNFFWGSIYENKIYHFLIFIEIHLKKPTVYQDLFQHKPLSLRLELKIEIP